MRDDNYEEICLLVRNGKLADKIVGELVLCFKSQFGDIKLSDENAFRIHRILLERLKEEVNKQKQKERKVKR